MKLKERWGMTETCLRTAPAIRRKDRKKPGSIGLMLPASKWTWSRWRIPRKVLPPGEVGEIRIRGPNVTKGYWNRPEETAEAFVGDRFLTGDIGYMDQGRLFLPGRPQEGHDHLRRLQRLSADDRAGDVRAPRRARGDLIGIPDDYRGEAAKAFVKLRTGAKPFTLEELKAFLAGKLGKHEIPAALEFVDELPRTSVGKLSRHELRNQQPRRNSRSSLQDRPRVSSDNSIVVPANAGTHTAMFPAYAGTAHQKYNA